MKKLVRKLALSCVALAACALTLVSTTYAWWTTNTDVTASNVEGQAATSGDASIFISKDNTNWGQSVDLKDLMYDSDNKLINVNMVPVQMTNKTGLGTFANIDGDATPAGAYMTFTLYFKTAVTANPVPIYIQNLSLANKSNTLVPYDNLLFNSSATLSGGEAKPAVGVDRGKSLYAVDIVNALYMHTTSFNPALEEASRVYTLDTNINLESIATERSNLSSGNSDTVTLINKAADEQALNYYNEVMGENLSDTTGISYDSLNFNAGYRTQVALCPADGSSVAVTFTIFLNGWDGHCYDACKTQGFVISFDFTSVNA